MRHVLGLASSRSTLCLLKPSFSLYRPLLLPSRSLTVSPSQSIRRRRGERLLPKTKLYQISHKISGTIDAIEAEHTKLLRLIDLADTHEKEDLLAALQENLDRVQRPLNALKAGNWEILNPELSSDVGGRMHSHIQFITTPTSDTPGTALHLHFDDRRYIIGNAHEGLQRSSLQMGTRIFRSKDIFLTGKTDWRSNGGLMGLILSVADAINSSAESKKETARLRLEKKRDREGNHEEGNMDMKLGIGPPPKAPTPVKNQVNEEDLTIRLHGGPNLTHTIATARSFIFRRGTPLKVLEHTEEGKVMDTAKQNWEPTWSDPFIQVWAMPITSSDVSEVSEDPSPESPRKRSLDEYMSGQGPGEAETFNEWFAEDNQKTREFVVSQMFSSRWNQDDLEEMPLRNVKMPATIYIQDPVTKELTLYEVPDATSPVPDINVFVRKPWPGARIDHLPRAKRSQTAMSYIIRNHKLRGKFNPAAAKELNVPPGPLWTTLATGSSVRSSDGRTVTPEMVLGPSKVGSGVAVVDLPSSDYVHDLINRPEWDADKVMSGVVAIIWILGTGVVQDKSLIRFIEGRSGVQHIISSPEHCPNYITMNSAATMAIHHSQIDPARYAVPLHSNTVSPSGSSDTGKTIFELMPETCRPAKRGLKIMLEPHFGVTEEAVTPFLDTDLVAQSTPQKVLDLSSAARHQISTPAIQAETLGQDIPSPDAEIICLGTGSAIPSPYRNVAATLLRVPGCGSYLMDCGENTLGQLKRMYTGPQLAELFHDLKLIWISHLHADHHLGLTSVIKAWYEEVHGKVKVETRKPTLTEQMLDPARFIRDSKRLFIVGNKDMMRWLEEYSSVEDYGYDQLFPIASTPYNIATDAFYLEWNGTHVGFQDTVNPKVGHAIRDATGLSDLLTCAVMHCWGAQAVSLTFPTGFKFSYSGDCRPSKRFAEIGKDSTVLVHEATFDDDLEREAFAKKHSTTSEAIGVGVAMRARRVILTHFSQRYQKIPSVGALDTCRIRLEDAVDSDDPSEGMDAPIGETIGPVEPQTSTDTPDDETSETRIESQTQEHVDEVNESDMPSSNANVVAQPITSEITPTPRPRLEDMRIGVAFDHMRVKVGDIIHLDRFTPALVELYDDIADKAKNDIADKTERCKPAEEAFSHDEKIIFRKVRFQKKAGILLPDENNIFRKMRSKINKSTEKGSD